MELKLDESYIIKGEENQWVLLRKCNKRWVTEGYFLTIINLLTYFVDLKIRRSDVRSISELLQYQKDLVTSLNTTLQPLQIEVVNKNVGEMIK